MPSVNSTIRNIIREKDAGIRSGVKAMRDVLRELQVQVQAELGAAVLGSWDAYYLKTMLSSIERQVANTSTKATGIISGLMEESWDQGLKMVDSPLAVAGIYSGFTQSSSSVTALTMKEFGEHITKNLFGDAYVKIKSELTLGILGGKTPQEVSKAIGKRLKDPSIFRSISARAEAITKTEMGKSFSKATQLRMDEAAENVEGLEKQWRHSGHPKVPRISHVIADGQHVPVNEPFRVAGILMMHPRDPGAPVKEIINCGCDHVPYHERWAEGKAA